MKSIASNADPLAKGILLLEASVLGGISSSPRMLLASIGILLALFTLCDREDLGRSKRYLFVVVFVPTLLLVFHTLIVPVATSSFSFTTDYLLEASVYSLRILNSLIALVFLLATTDIRLLVVRLSTVGLPYSLAFALFLMLRFIDLFASDARSVRDALLLRSGGRKLSWQFVRSMFQNYVPVLTVIGLLRADQTAMAMDLRGHATASRRTSMRGRNWPKSSWLLPTLYAAFALALKS